MNRVLSNGLGLVLLWGLSTMAQSLAGRGGPIDMSKPVVATIGALDFRECTVEANGLDRLVQCAWLKLPEDFQRPESTQIEVFVVRIPARKIQEKALEPMLFLAGGPGQAASQAYLHIDRVFKDLAKSRDFYLVDQRGTGYSNKLSCEQVIDAKSFLLTEFDSEKQKALLRECLHSLPGDPRFYTTSIAIQDLEKVRETLGVKQWNILGISYGTRVGLHYMRRHPGNIRTAVLDSVVPPELILGADIAEFSQKILDYMYRRCEDDEACNTRFPDLESKVKTLLFNLESSPIKIQVENFKTGEVESLDFTRDHLAGLIRLYLYDSASLALLPPMLYAAAAKGNLAPLARSANIAINTMGAAMSLGMHNAVICSEDQAFITEDKNRLGKNKETYLGLDIVEALELNCDIWPKGVVDEDFKAPVKSNIPTLLFSGQYDPITPPEYADAVLKHLSRARHFVLTGQGHSVSTKGCAPHIVDKFVSDASVEQLQASCLQRMHADPLFINFNGSTP